MTPLMLVALLLPGLYWDRGADAAPAIKQAGIERVFVPTAQVEAWRQAGLKPVPFELRQFVVKLDVPKVEFHMNEASATSEPWIDANGWRILRGPHGPYYYDVPDGRAAMALAEAFAYNAPAVVRPVPADLGLAGRMLGFLRGIDGPPLHQMANIGIYDDRSDQTGEVLNLLVRRNLLFNVITGSDDRHYDLTIRIGSPQYPKAEAADPYEFAQKVRRDLGDDRRLLRIYGSQTVIGRLAGDGRRVRVHLLNYAPRPVAGLRVRVLGAYTRAKLTAFENEKSELKDYAADATAAEFTIPELNTYAVVDLFR